MNVPTQSRSDEPVTQREFRAWLNRLPSSDINHYELLNGQIVMEPPAGWPHAGIGSKLNALIGRHVQKNRLGIVLDASAGYDLPTGDTVEPDVSFISAKRLAAGPRPSRGQFLRIVPDLIVEILSPSTARKDRMEKKHSYERSGVNEYWLVDPDQRSVTVFILGQEGYSRGRVFRAGTFRSRALSGLIVSVRDIFSI